MTKDQKVKQVTDQVEEARRFYSQDEYVNMIRSIWQGFDAAKAIAQDSGVRNANPVS